MLLYKIFGQLHGFRNAALPAFDSKTFETASSLTTTNENHQSMDAIVSRLLERISL